MINIYFEIFSNMCVFYILLFWLAGLLDFETNQKKNSREVAVMMLLLYPVIPILAMIKWCEQKMKYANA